MDGLICKVHLIASKAGVVEDSLLGIPIQIKGGVTTPAISDRRKSAISATYNDEGDNVLINEVKRVGFLIDRYVDLQLRVGDSLVLYL